MKNTVLILLGLSGLLMWRVSESGWASESPKVAVKVDFGKYADLHRQQIELGAQFRLLTDLAAVHANRAAEAEKGNLPEKARWEAEVAGELKAKAGEIGASAEFLNRQRLDLEVAANSTNSVVRLNADETAYLTRLDTLVWSLEEEMREAQTAAQVYSAQLITNTLPEDVARISFEVQQNNQVLRFLERERAMLDLKKLEYRALVGSGKAGAR